MATQQNLLSRFYEYQWERFPFVIVFLTSVVVLGSSLVVLDAQVGVWRLVAGFLTMVLFPFHMRLFDELKDREHDGQYYPDRPVSRGLISIREIKLVLFFVLAIEVLLNVWWGLDVLISLVVALAFSALAAREFFIRQWLREHFFTYLILHQFQLAFVLPYLYLLLGGRLDFGDQLLVAHFVMVFVLLFLLEWARKMRREEDEVASRDTYSARLGRSGSATVYGLLAIVATASFVFIARSVLPAGEVWGWLAMILTFLAGLSYAKNFYKRSDAGVQLAALGLYLILNGLLSIPALL